jgi:hypothetical protein
MGPGSRTLTAHAFVGVLMVAGLSVGCRERAAEGGSPNDEAAGDKAAGNKAAGDKAAGDKAAGDKATAKPQAAAAADQPPPANEGASTPAADDAGAPTRFGPFCVASLLLRDGTAPASRVPALDNANLEAAVRKGLAQVEPIDVVRRGEAVPCPEGRALSEQLGVGVDVAWALIGEDGRPPADVASLERGELRFGVAVHVERPQPGGRGKPLIAQSQLDGAVPLALPDPAKLASFISVRLQRATSLATLDAVGQLVARPLSDNAVIELLEPTRRSWQQAAAAREIGERGLSRARPAVEKLARDSRKELAVVACAALGRLGDAQSVPVLEEALAHRHLEVVDASMVALLDIGTPGAREAVAKLTQSHPIPLIRQRAGALLQGDAP